MGEEGVPLILISGPVGVGKTIVSEEVSDILVQKNIPHTLLDLDVLAETYPRPADDRFNQKLALQNLRDVWQNCVAAGSRNLIIARVVETERDIRDISNCIPNSHVKVCKLEASDAVLVERIRKREIGSGLAWHQQRSLELAGQLRQTGPADFTIDTTDLNIIDIASKIVREVSWVV